MCAFPFCCCPCDDEFEEYAPPPPPPTNSIYYYSQNVCICLRFFLHHLFTGYTTLFHRLDGRSPSSSSSPAPNPNQGATSWPSSGIASTITDTSLDDAHLSVSRPVPYDADQRYSRLQRDGLVSRRDKSITHFLQESQPLIRNLTSSSIQPLGFGKKHTGIDSEEDGKLGVSEPSDRALGTKSGYGLVFVQPCSEDEDVCPTCLDEYTPENPKITTRCSHHFHLGCIYEWMERSESCPICGKEMDFCESP